jgi:hypothetical protein
MTDRRQLRSKGPAAAISIPETRKYTSRQHNNMSASPHHEEAEDGQYQAPSSPHNENNNNRSPSPRTHRDEEPQHIPATQLSIEELRKILQQKEKEQLVAAVKERHEKELKDIEQGIVLTVPVAPTTSTNIQRIPRKAGTDDTSSQTHEHKHTGMPSTHTQHTHSATTTHPTPVVTSKRWADMEEEDEDGNGGDDAVVGRQAAGLNRYDVTFDVPSTNTTNTNREREFSRVMISLDKAKMDKFDGNNKNLNILEFLQKLNDIYATYDIPPERKVQVFKKFCTGDAYYWIDDILEDWARISRRPMPYDVLLEKAYKQYTTPMTIYDKKDFLSTIRQFSDENSKTYCNRIKRLARAKGIVEDRLISDAYWQGLREQIKGIIGLKIGFDEIEGHSTLQMSELATQAELTLDKLEGKKFNPRRTVTDNSTTSRGTPTDRRMGRGQAQGQQPASTHNTRENTNGARNACYICGDTGHYANACPRNNNRSEKKCNSCFNSGKPENVYMSHYTNECNARPTGTNPKPTARGSTPSANTPPDKNPSKPPFPTSNARRAVSNMYMDREREKDDYVEDDSWTYGSSEEESDNEQYATDESDTDDVSHNSVCAMTHDVGNTYKERQHTLVGVEQDQHQIGQSPHMSHDVKTNAQDQDTHNGFDPIRNGFDPTRNGFDPTRNGFDPTHNGFDPIHNGFDPIRNGSNPVSTNMHNIVNTRRIHAALPDMKVAPMQAASRKGTNTFILPAYVMGKKANFIVDSGADGVSCISKRLFDSFAPILQEKLKEPKYPLKLRNVDGGAIKIVGVLHAILYIETLEGRNDVQQKVTKCPLPLYVLANLEADGLLGSDFLLEYTTGSRYSKNNTRGQLFLSDGKTAEIFVYHPSSSRRVTGSTPIPNLGPQAKAKDSVATNSKNDKEPKKFLPSPYPTPDKGQGKDEVKSAALGPAPKKGLAIRFNLPVSKATSSSDSSSNTATISPPESKVNAITSHESMDKDHKHIDNCTQCRAFVQTHSHLIGQVYTHSDVYNDVHNDMTGIPEPYFPNGKKVHYMRRDVDPCSRTPKSKSSTCDIGTTKNTSTINKTYMLRASKRMRLPANTISTIPHTHIRGYVQERDKQQLFVESHLDEDSPMLCRVGKSLHTIDNLTFKDDKHLTEAQPQMTISMINLYNRPVLIRKNQIIGRVTVVNPKDVLEKEQADIAKSKDVIPELAKKLLEKLNITGPHTALKSEADRKLLYDTIYPFLHLFDTREYGEARDISGHAVEHTIDTGDAKPIHQRAYRQAPAMTKIIEETIDMRLRTKAIRPSSSPWSAPIVMVRKPGINNWRMCVDYRGLNQATKPDVYPIPPIDTLLYSMQGARIFTKIDLEDAYHQIRIAFGDIYKTAFIHKNGLYEYTRMPFGLRNAPATFQRYINAMIASLNKVLYEKWLQDVFDDKDKAIQTLHHLLAYLDDIILHSVDLTEHVQHLRVLCQLLSLHGLKAKLSKCEFARSRIQYLGHLIDEEGIRVDPEKVKAIQAMPIPKNITDVQSFLGMCGYYRRFIPKYTEIAHALYQLLQKNIIWSWTEDCSTSMKNLQQALIQSPVLLMPDFTKPFVVQTDASYVGIGAVLSQYTKIGDEMIDQPVCYESRSLRKAERNYAAYEIELLALVHAIKKFRPFIMGSKFVVQTDHRALQWLKRSRDLSGRLARWALLLQEYDFEVMYRKGKDNANADALSRLPITNANEIENDTDLELDSTSLKRIYKQITDTSYQRRVCYIKSVPKSTMCMHTHTQEEKDFSLSLDQQIMKQTHYVYHLHNNPIMTRSEAKIADEQDKQLQQRLAQPSHSTIPTLPVADKTELEEGEVDMSTYYNALADNVALNAWTQIRDNISIEDKKYYKSVSTADIGAIQKSDIWWKDIYIYLDTGAYTEGLSNRLKQEISHKAQHYILRDHVLYHVHHTKNKADSTIILQLCIVQSDVPAILNQLHTEPTGGHLSTVKVFDKAINKYFWPNMYTDIETKCKTCEICIRKQTPKHLGQVPPMAPQTDIYIKYGPMEGLAIDTIGPLPGRIRYLLTVCDTNTRWGEVYILKQQTTQEIVQQLVSEWMCRKGIPKAILSDNGSAFASHIYSSCLRKMGVQVKYITKYRPQSNGICERLNGTIKNMLKSYVYDNHKDWVKYLPYIMFAYNTSTHPATGYTPFFLLHGKEANLGCEALLAGSIDNDIHTHEQYVQDMYDNFALAHKNITDRVQAKADRQYKKMIEKSKTYRAYQIGQLVYIYVPPKSNAGKYISAKFSLRYKGPYRVVKQINPVTYLCEKVEQPTKTKLAHFTQMKSVDGTGPLLRQEHPTRT